MTGTDYQPRGRAFTGQKMLASMLMFFGVIIAANLTMAWFAVTGFHGVVVENGYVASQGFNTATARLAVQTARGWQVTATAPGHRPQVQFADAAGAPLTGLALRVTALRQDNQRDDRALTWAEVAPGTYLATQTLAPGAWDLALTATGRGAPYAVTKPLFIAPGN